MKPFLSILTAACVSTHMVWGCCRHDAHAATDDGCGSCVVDEHGSGLDDHSGGCPSNEPVKHSSPQGHCPDGNCSVVRSAAWQDTLSASSLLSTAPIMATELTLPAISAGHCIDLETALCPVSLHHWRQILLI